MKWSASLNFSTMCNVEILGMNGWILIPTLNPRSFKDLYNLYLSSIDGTFGSTSIRLSIFVTDN